MNLIRPAGVSILLLLSSSCSSLLQRSVDYSKFYCDVSGDGQHPLDSRPEKAVAFRDIARLHPNNPGTFGPPPRQQAHSGKRWDTSNEYWFSDASGGIHLYSNTDDGYAYHWEFESVSSTSLLKHGLLNCGCHFCTKQQLEERFTREEK